MQAELVAILCIIFCLFLLGFEYLWLALLAKRQEDDSNLYLDAAKKCNCMIEGILYGPTEKCREKETQELKKLMGDDIKMFEIINSQLCYWDEFGDEETLENKSEIIDKIYEVLNPVGLCGEIVRQQDKYKIGYACRRLADFDAYDYLKDIYELSKSKNRETAYHAAMALARLGYTEGVAEFIVRIENDRNYSCRIVNELFDDFSLSRYELAEAVFEKCGEYMKTVVIKAIAHYKISEFEPMYIDGTTSKNKEMRVACVKAIGYFAKPEYEHLLLTAAKDKVWIVRSAAIRGLERLGTPGAVNGIKEAMKDNEWWVRQTAATALIDMNVNISEIEEILSGYDKYASDAAKYALYRSVDLNEKKKK